MNHLVSYDISDNRLRLGLARSLLRRGLYRLQFSVFLGPLSARSTKQLKKELAQYPSLLLWTTSDSILLLPLHQYSKEEVVVIGQTPKDWDLILGNQSTLVM